MLMITAKILTILNIILIVALLIQYIKSLQRIKVPFTLGLIAFSLLFFVHNIVCLYFYLTMQPYYAPGSEVFAVVLSATQTIAFGVLTWMTYR